jgi:hypothetical protein
VIGPNLSEWALAKRSLVIFLMILAWWPAACRS